MASRLVFSVHRTNSSSPNHFDSTPLVLSDSLDGSSDGIVERVAHVELMSNSCSSFIVYSSLLEFYPPVEFSYHKSTLVYSSLPNLHLLYPQFHLSKSLYSISSLLVDLSIYLLDPFLLSSPKAIRSILLLWTVSAL